MSEDGLIGLYGVAALLLVGVAVAIVGAVRERRPRSAEPGPRNPMAGLVFKNNDAFIEYLNQYGEREIVTSRPIHALVVDAQKVFGLSEPVRVQEDGSQTVALDVAMAGGGFRTIATTPSGKNELLRAGDLVAWLPMQKGPNKLHHDERSRWIGLVVAKCAPGYDEHGPVVLQYY